jgi:hypothetical protein
MAFSLVTLLAIVCAISNAGSARGSRGWPVEMLHSLRNFAIISSFTKFGSSAIMSL